MDAPGNLVESYPRLMNMAVQAVKAAAESLEQLPAGESAEVLARALGGVDGRQLGEAVNAVSRLLIAVHQARPGLLAESRVGVVAGVVEVVDFGKLRVALTEQCHSSLSVLEGKLDQVAGSPLALANLLNVAPQVANDLLRIAAKALGYLKFPDEVLASALFTLLRDIDMSALADLLNGATALVVALSRGDRLLGGVNEPYFKQVLDEMVDEVAAGVDPALLQEAGQALGSDLKVVGEVASGRVSVDTGAMAAKALARLKEAVLSHPVVKSKLAPAEIDAAELERTVEGLVDRAVEAALRNGSVVRAVLRPAGRGLLRYLNALLKKSRFSRFLNRKKK